LNMEFYWRSLLFLYLVLLSLHHSEIFSHFSFNVLAVLLCNLSHLLMFHIHNVFSFSSFCSTYSIESCFFRIRKFFDSLFSLIDFAIDAFYILL
jgi:hypothetical protein